MKKPPRETPTFAPGAWTPRRKGDIYCSPACGGETKWGCTWAEYQAAKRAAKALCDRIGKGWRPRVWENLGWHYSAISPCGRLKVHPSTSCRCHGKGTVTSYTAFLGEADSPGGRWTGQSRSPKRAVALAVEEGRRALDEVNSLVEGL